MKKHAIAALLLVALVTGITLSKTNAYAKAKQQTPISQNPHDGNPKPVCPPPPNPCF